jgi:hypothetical protein
MGLHLPWAIVLIRPDHDRFSIDKLDITFMDSAYLFFLLEKADKVASSVFRRKRQQISKANLK